MSRRTRALIGLAAVVLGAAAIIIGPRALRRVPFFQVQRVEVDGLLYLDEHDVVRRLGLRPDASVFDPIAPLQAAAAVIPGVVAARVTRRLPGTLRVELYEATPVAFARQPDRLVMVDHAAAILPFDPSRKPASLPIAERDPATTTLLARIMMADPEWYDSIDTAGSERGDIVIESSGRRVRLRPGATRETLRSVALVRDYLTQHAVEWREIDARYTRRVFVRRGPA